MREFGRPHKAPLYVSSVYFTEAEQNVVLTYVYIKNGEYENKKKNTSQNCNSGLGARKNEFSFGVPLLFCRRDARFARRRSVFFHIYYFVLFYFTFYIHIFVKYAYVGIYLVRVFRESGHARLGH